MATFIEHRIHISIKTDCASHIQVYTSQFRFSLSQLELELFAFWMPCQQFRPSSDSLLIIPACVERNAKRFAEIGLAWVTFQKACPSIDFHVLLLSSIQSL